MAGAVLGAAGLALGFAAVEVGLDDPVPAPVAEQVDSAPRAAEPSAAPAARSHAATKDKREPTVRRRPGVPLRVALPALGVDAKVVPVSSNDGTLVPPDDPQQLGWWSGGVKPGSKEGRALVTGHTVHTGGGALDDLEQLSPGDRVVVRTGRGRLEYAVRSVRYLTIDEVAERAPRLFRATGPERLVIVTCEGWDGTDYEGNTIVVATPVA